MTSEPRKELDYYTKVARGIQKWEVKYIEHHLQRHSVYYDCEDPVQSLRRNWEWVVVVLVVLVGWIEFVKHIV